MKVVFIFVVTWENCEIRAMSYVDIARVVYAPLIEVLVTHVSVKSSALASEATAGALLSSSSHVQGTLL